MRKVSISILVMAAMLGFGREAGAVSLCDADAGNLIQNCGFETGSMSPWTVAGTPDLAYNLVQINLIHSGTYAFEFANFASEGLAGPSQGISDVSGATYNFSFWLLSNDATDQQIQVFWNGTSLLELNGASFAWTQHTFQVVAFVLHHPRVKITHGAVDCRPTLVKSTIAQVPEARHKSAHAGDAEAAFLVRCRVRRRRQDLRVDEHHARPDILARVVIRHGGKHHQTLRHPHLRRGKPDARLGIHRLEHVRDQALQPVERLLDRRRLLPQHRRPIRLDLQQRDGLASGNATAGRAAATWVRW